MKIEVFAGNVLASVSIRTKRSDEEGVRGGPPFVKDSVPSKEKLPASGMRKSGSFLPLRRIHLSKLTAQSSSSRDVFPR